MVVKVIKPFVDVMGLPHKKGETLTLSENGMKIYAEFVKEVKNGTRNSSSTPKTKPADNE